MGVREAVRLCDICGINEAEPDRYRSIEGWEEVRSQGGANKIIGRRDTGRRACRYCIYEIEQGLSPGQGTLL